MAAKITIARCRCGDFCHYIVFSFHELDDLYQEYGVQPVYHGGAK